MEAEKVIKQEVEIMKTVRWGFLLTALLFVASGFSSLIYQVVWTRLLVLVFGSTTFATATVLAVFMGGLALGSYVAGRVSDKVKRPFLWYGILEGVIGLWALLVPFLFEAAVPLYRVVWQSMHPTVIPFSLLRCLMAGAILIIPTSCMGATLPLLARFVTSSLDLVGRRVGTLYSVNTLGAVAGATLAGFILLPQFGLNAATLIAALINFLLCGAVILVAPALERQSESERGSDAVAVENKTGLSWLIRLTVFSFGVSGAVAMIYEVGWTRTLLMVIGSSTYAFTVMLATFLVGIFLGSLICSRFIDKAKEPVVWFAIFEFMVCFFGLTSMMEFNYLPWWNLTINANFPADPTMSVAVRFLLSSFILLPLTLCLGAIFPAVVKTCTRELEAVGKSVGTLYSVNTLGAIIGAFLAGFILVPWLGVERTLVFASVVNLVLGMVLLCLIESIRKPIKILAVVFAVPVMFWCVQMPELWDRVIMLSAQAERRQMVETSVTHRDFDKWCKALHDSADVLFWKDGASSTVGILQYKSSGHRSLVTNGHVDASDGIDKSTQVLLAGYPLLWKPDARDVAVVGWGSGMSVGTAGLFPVKSVTAIELEPSVLDASKFFHRVNHRPETNPLVKLEVNDGRNYLLATDKKFDVIISEPSNPWQAGVCNLFTREYFQICRNRLNPGGVMSFWLQTVEIPPNNLGEILASLHAVFPYNLALMSDRGNLVVLASGEPLTIDYIRLAEVFKNKDIAHDLDSVSVGSPESVLSRIESNPDGIAEIAAGKPMNVDDTNRLEYAVGKTYENRFFNAENRDLLQKHLGAPWQLVSFSGIADGQRARIMATVGKEALLSGRPSVGLAWAQASLAVAPTAEGLRIAGIANAEMGRVEAARMLWTRALSIDPKHIETLQTRGVSNFMQGLVTEARADFQKVLAVEPANRVARLHLAETYASSQAVNVAAIKGPVFFPSAVPDQSPETVISQLSSLLNDKEFLQRHPEVLFLSAQAHYQLAQFKEAETQARQYLDLQPGSISGKRLMGSLLQHREQAVAGAGFWFASFSTTARQGAQALIRTAKQELAAKREDLAVASLTRALELWPGDQEAFAMLSNLSRTNAGAARVVSSLKMLSPVLVGATVNRQ